MTYLGKWCASVLVGLCALSPFAGQSASILYNFGNTFSGDSPESGLPPWLTAVFEDVTPGTVRLTLSNPGLTGTENVDEVYFNLNPLLNPLSLTFSPVSSSGSFDLPGFLTGTNQFKADGDGKYDVKMVFALGGTDANRFTLGETLVLDISGIPTLGALDFTYMSAPAGGAGPFYAAAHVQRIGTNSLSGWISPMGNTFILIPEPSTGALLAIALPAWLAWRKRRAN